MGKNFKLNEFKGSQNENIKLNSVIVLSIKYNIQKFTKKIRRKSLS